MADNVTLPGTGLDIAADEISGVKLQRIKMVFGSDGVSEGDVSSSNPLPVRAAGVVSSQNTTTTPLSGSATYTGTLVQSTYPDVMVSIKADQDCILYFDFSNDGTNVDTFPSAGFYVHAGVHAFHVAVKGPRYFRTRVVNLSSSAMTYLRCYTYFGQFRQGNSPINQAVDDTTDSIIVKSISEETLTMQGLFTERYIETKFGRNTNIDTGSTPEDIWGGGGVYYGQPIGVSAEIVQVFSSDANDTSAGTGARTVRIYGLDANYALQQETITLNGTTPSNSSNIYMRVFRVVVLTAGTSETNVGNITTRWATTTSVVFSVVPIGYGQSELAAYTVPAGKTAYVRRYAFSVLSNTSARVVAGLRVREFGGAWRIIRPGAFSHSSPLTRTLYGGFSIPEKTDIVARVLSVTSNNADVACDFTMEVIDN